MATSSTFALFLHRFYAYGWFRPNSSSPIKQPMENYEGAFGFFVSDSTFKVEVEEIRTSGHGFCRRHGSRQPRSVFSLLIGTEQVAAASFQGRFRDPDRWSRILPSAQQQAVAFGVLPLIEPSRWLRLRFGDDSVHSTEQVLAADILCEIACCPDPMQDAKSSTDRIRWPKPPSMKTMKARKLLPSIDKPHQSFTTVACSNSIKKAGLPFSKHHLGAVRSDRDSVRWSSVASGATSPLSKLDEGLNSRLPPFPSHADKVYQNQQRKPPPMLAVAFEGSSIRDWIRGRSRRL